MPSETIRYGALAVLNGDHYMKRGKITPKEEALLGYTVAESPLISDKAIELCRWVLSDCKLYGGWEEDLHDLDDFLLNVGIHIEISMEDIIAIKEDGQWTLLTAEDSSARRCCLDVEAFEITSNSASAF